MNRNIIKLLSFCLLCVICFMSCERYPVRALLGLSDPIGSWPNPWYLYDDEINTKGSMEPYVFDHNEDGSPNPYCDTWKNVSLSFKCTDMPQAGTKCIKFVWVGNSNGSGKTFFSFGLQAREEKGGKVDLKESGYTNLRFWIKGNLYSNCVFEIGIPGSSTTRKFSSISPYWEEYIIPIEGIGEIEYDLSMSLSTNGITNGGTVYIDNIRLTKD